MTRNSGSPEPTSWARVRGGSVSRWRAAGFGRRRSAPDAEPLRSPAREPKHAPAADRPAIKCPSCHGQVPIDGKADDPVAKAQAWTAHYDEHPECEKKNRSLAR